MIQGSKCGPLLYDIYVNEISKICEEREYLMFSDDTVLIYSGPDLDGLVGHVNNRLDNIADWCKI